MPSSAQGRATTLTRRLMAVWLLVAAGAATAMAQQPPAPAVGVVAVTLQDVTPRARFTGRAEAVDRVELRARVQGFLDQRLFDEGSTVEQGDLLFVIEKAPYQAVLAQRQAELASAQADVENAAAQLARGEQLLGNNNIPAAEVDERRARLLIAQAAVLEVQAAIQQAQLNLGYTDVIAPIGGRIGRAAYSEGAFVGPESGSLAVIVSQDPIYVTFPVSQAILTEVRQQAIARGTPLEIVVRAELPTGDHYEHPGKLAFADVEVARGTDTLTLRASFPNPNGLLTPGQFLNVVVEEDEPVQALVVPGSAILVDQAGPYVLVVGDDGVATQRRVTLGQSEGANAVIEDGLVADELVIVEGIQKVRPGQPVTATPVQSAAQ